MEIRMHSKVMVAVALVTTCGMAFADPDKDESGKGKDRERHGERERHEASQHHDGKSHEGKSYFHRQGYTRLKIPEGHYPPPGECRFWYPDKPAGQQPPPVKCDTPAPRGAWVIEHPADKPKHVHITVYEPERPRVARAVGEFEIGSGVLVRVIFDKPL
jgi:hypothetical protein